MFSSEGASNRGLVMHRHRLILLLDAAEDTSELPGDPFERRFTHSPLFELQVVVFASNLQPPNVEAAKT